MNALERVGEPHDRDAALFRSIYPGLRRYAAVVGAAADDPDDLVQEAVTRTLRFRSLAELDNAGAFLRRSIANLVINGIRAEEVTRRRGRLLDQPVHAVDAYPSDLDVLSILRPIDRAVVYLADVEGRSLSEVASIVGRSPVAARLRASRARRSLRRLIEEQT